MRNFYILALIAVIFSLLSCKKEEGVELPNAFPVSFKAERIEVKGQTRLFANKLEIKDAAVIQAYELQHPWSEEFLTDFEQYTGDFEIKFQSDQRASFKNAHSEVDYDVDRKGTRFLFYGRLPYALNPSAIPDGQSLGYLHSMLEYADKLTNLAVPVGDLRFNTREVRVAHGNYKVFKLSTTAYRLHLEADGQDGSGDNFLNGYLYNEFNPTVSKFLGAQDTLAVREYAIIFTLVK